MTIETYDFINQDLDTVKSIFLETIHIHYASLTSVNAKPKTRSFCTAAQAFFCGEKIELNTTIINSQNYGKLNIGTARNFLTGEEGLKRVKHFFDETKNCTSVKAFMDKAADFYHNFKYTKFAETLAIAAAKSARLRTKYIQHTGTNYINLIDSDRNPTHFINIFRGDPSEIAEAGNLILKQIKNTFLSTEESLQQLMFRKLPMLYTGNKALQLQCDSARQNRAEASFNYVS